jgi:hypothetical protein
MKYTKNSILKGLLLGAMFAATLAIGTNSAQAAYGIDFPVVLTTLQEDGAAVGTLSNPYPVIGWSFRANKDLYLTRLGVYDADIERRHTELHYVGIWNASDTTTALRTVSISENNLSTAPEFNQGAYFHFAGLEVPLLLKAGETYHVGATVYTGTATKPGLYDMFASFNAGQYSVTVNNDITYLKGVNGVTNSAGQLVFPGTVDTYATYTIGANIDVTPTPIPAAAWLLGSGLLGLIGIRRRNS